MLLSWPRAASSQYCCFETLKVPNKAALPSALPEMLFPHRKARIALSSTQPPLSRSPTVAHLCPKYLIAENMPLSFHRATTPSLSANEVETR